MRGKARVESDLHWLVWVCVVYVSVTEIGIVFG